MSKNNDAFDISPDEELIEVEIDGLPTPVSKVDWDRDQDAVTKQVIDARAALRFDVSASNDYADYDEIVAQLGQDGEPDDEVE